MTRAKTTEHKYPKDKTIHRLFEEQVERTPGNIAVVYEGIELTYSELNERANKMANYLRDIEDIKPDTLISICLDRSEHMLIAILAVMKAGGAYVPIDPTYPEERIGYILGDTRANIILTNQRHLEKLGRAQKIGEKYNIIAIDSAKIQRDVLNSIATTPVTSTLSNNLAYVIYTSGTTGNPKGVMIEHHSLVSKIIYIINKHNISSSYCIGAKIPFVFDPSLREMFLALIVGAKLMIIPDLIYKDTNKLLEYCTLNPINLLIFVPSQLAGFIQSMKGASYTQLEALKNLQMLYTCGEVLPRNLVSKLKNYLPNLVLKNQYGPTECCLFSFEFDTEFDNLNSLSIPVGKPISNTKAYVLSNKLAPVPIGVIGELYIGGEGVGRGYLNRPELSKECFIENPFQSKNEKENSENSRLYKTGDLVRWLDDGNLEYLGRNDYQVKIRGYRVELGEIESVLLSYPEIRQTVVIAKDHVNKEGEERRGKYVVSYYTADKEIEEEILQSYMESKLPEYMIPNVFVYLDKLPLTANGKIDRSSLPDLDIGGDKQTYEAPRNELESKICDIFGEVLGFEGARIGIRDDFFRLGGDSIVSIQLVSRLRQRLGLKIKLQDIFNYRSIKKLYDNILSNENEIKGKSKTTQEIFSRNGNNYNIISQEYLTILQQDGEVENVYLASSLQQGFIYHALARGDKNDAYIGQNTWKYHVGINSSQLQKAWEYAQAKFASLRTRFAWEEELVQVINREGSLDWRYIDLSSISDGSEQKKVIKGIQKEDREEAYDLSLEGLFRVYLIKQREELYTCIFSSHHAIIDGWSNSVLFAYVHQVYLDLLENKNITIEPDHAYCLAHKYLQEHAQDHEDYWKDYVSKIEERIDLSGLLSSEKKQGRLKISEHKRVKDLCTESLIIQGDLYSRLKETSKRAGVTINAILQYAWHKILHIYGNTEQTVVGTTVSGRNLPIDGIESSVGLYVNTLPLIVEHGDKKRKIIEIIKEIQDDINEINSRSNVNLAKLQKESERLFDSLFAYQNYPNLIDPIHQSRCKITFETSVEKIDYPLWIWIHEVSEKIVVNLTYAGEIFDKKLIEGLLSIIEILVDQIANDINKETGELQYLSYDQHQKIIHEWNRSEHKYPKDKTIHRLFEEQVEKTPGNIAVVYEDTRLTYRELNERANKMANYLRDIEDIKPDTLISICLDRSEHMLIAILAVMKAGGAYVPIDPTYPEERIGYILGDTRANIILTNQRHLEKLGRAQKIGEKYNIIAIDSAKIQRDVLNSIATTPVTSTLSNNLAYVIYTSGTTGNPKGVMQLHSNIMRLFTATEQLFYFNSKDVWTLFHSYVFDFSVWEIWGALIYGGKLVIPSYEQTRDLEAFYNLCINEQITVLNQTPTAFYQFADIAISHREKGKLMDLRYVIFGGETLNFNQISAWFNCYGDGQPKLINMYGITETTVHVTYKHITKMDIGSSSCIGRVIPDLTAYVLENNFTPLPIGAIGELYIGGAGLARGYLNQPELTAAKFISNPFQTEQEKYNKSSNNKGVNALLYKTGDLARWSQEGELEYLGRNDFQVKIRGYRIELGDIESAISSYKDITQSVVIARERDSNDGISSNGKYLVAYYVRKLELEDEDTHGYIGFWETLYEAEYVSLNIENFKNNIKGWNSSYTGEMIPEDEMREWIDGTVNRIKGLGPNVILEIGSGSGLILFNIIDNCDHYYATDFSRNVIEYTKRVVNKFSYGDKVTTFCSAAAELPYKDLNGAYDTVVINSVMQYFPNLDYLESVINKAVDSIKDNGKIFIGDIRDYRLLECFHHSVQNYKNYKITKSAIEYLAQRDKELLVSPKYFIHLKGANTVISSVEILPKFGEADNELNNYRYDVILHIKKSVDARENNNVVVIDETKFIKAVDLDRYFATSDQPLLCLKYPNKRILGDYNRFILLYGDEIENKIDIEKYKDLLSISDIQKKAKSSGYDCKFSLDPQDPLFFDIIFYKTESYSCKNIHIEYQIIDRLHRAQLANNPLISAKLLESEFIKELKEYLMAKLPEYMVPELCIGLAKLPLTINGKLNRKALPEPVIGSIENYVAPSNEVERQICQIWSEVLGIPKDKVGTTDNFFSLGGDSILAIRLVGKINKACNSEVRVKDIFELRCVSKLVESMLTIRNIDTNPYQPFSLININDYKDDDRLNLELLEDLYPANYLQRGMLLEYGLDNTSNTYHDIAFYSIQAIFEESKFFSIWQQLIDKHELLRASFIDDKDNGYNVVIYKTIKARYQLYKNCKFNELLEREKLSKLDYNQPGLFRLLINDLGEHFEIGLTISHAISDGWSIASLLNDLVKAYIDDSSVFIREGVRYGECIKNELSALNNPAQINFWQNYLNSLDINNIRWKFDSEKSSNSLYTSGLTLEGLQAKAIHKLSKTFEISLDTIFLLTYIKTLSFFTDKTDIIVGLVVNNRPEKEGGDELFGMFLNTIPFRHNVSHNDSNYKQLQDVFNNKINLQGYRLLPYGYLKSLFKQELFKFAFSFTHFYVADVTASHVKKLGNYGRTNIPIVLEVAQKGNVEFKLNLIAHDDFISKSYLDYFMHYYHETLINILDFSEKIPTLTLEDFSESIMKFNATDVRYSPKETLNSLFVKQAYLYPEHIAIIDTATNKEYTYRSLLQDTGYLARHILLILHKFNTKERQNHPILIGVLAEKGYCQALSTLSILTAGYAYLPLNIQWPLSRINEVLELGEVKILLISKKEYNNSQLRKTLLKKYKLIVIEDFSLGVHSNKQFADQLMRTQLPEVNSNDIAYVIFTSGSTGLPKGVTINHKSAVNTIEAINKEFNITQNDKILALSELSFDLSVYDIFGILAAGATVIFPPQKDTQDPLSWLNIINKYKATIWNTVPQLSAMLIDESIYSYFIPASLRLFLLSGDWIPVSLPDRIKNILPEAQVVSLGGATEGSIWSIWYKIEKVKEGWGSIPYGRPMPNQKIYMLNSHNDVCPVGCIGEIYIGGIGVALNYWNDQPKTIASFIQHNKFGRLYKTGDFGRLHPDGYVEYLGRNDYQVKIRGYRVELGEIESVLLSYPEIRQTVVIAKDHVNKEGEERRGKYVVSYYTADKEIEEEILQSYMESKLPEYMIPNVFVYLDKLPLTANGKIDRSSLPDLDIGGDKQTYEAPRNELESKICDIFGEVLGFEGARIGIRDDFFRLGGDSIVSIQLVSRLRQRLGLNFVGVQDIFSHRTIERLCDNVIEQSIDNQINNKVSVITEQGLLTGEVPLLPIQKWFFDSKFEAPNHVNQSFLIKTPKLNLDLLKLSIEKLVEHHDAFRLRYRKPSKKPNHSHMYYTQYYDDKAKACDLKILDVRTLESEEDLNNVLTAWQSNFDLECSPLYSIGYIYGLKDESARIYFALHHLIVDTVSWRIITEDLKHLYFQAESGKTLDLGPKSSSYRQWANTLANYGKSIENEIKERDYWNTTLNNLDGSMQRLEALVLASQEATPKIFFSNFSLNKSLTSKLIKESGKAYNTEVNDLLLAALSKSLSEVIGSRVNHITLEGHGREERIGRGSLDISRTVGWFTTMLPVRLKVNYNLDKKRVIEIDKELSSIIKYTKELLRNIPNKGIGFGASIGYKLNMLPKIRFNYLGQLDPVSNQNNYGNDRFKLWNIVSEASGISTDSKNQDQNILDINGFITDERLQFGVVSKLGRALTDKLANVLKLKLEEVIKHCASQKRTYLTVSDVGNILSQEYLDSLQEEREIEAIYLANSLQQGFIYHYLNQGSIDDAYMGQSIWRYNTTINIHKLREAWKFAQMKFCSLRIRFAWEEELVQIIDKDGRLNWRYIDLSDTQDITIQDDKIKHICKKDKLEKYDTKAGSLFRVYIIKQKDNLHTCIFSSHHSIIDGWSDAILCTYINKTYLELLDNRPIGVTRDTSYELAQKYLQEHKEDNKEYWDKYVGKIKERMDLSGLLSYNVAQKRLKISEYKLIISPQTENLIIGGSLYHCLKEFSRREGITINAILQYVWHKILLIYGNVNQTVAGTTVSGRNLPVNNIESSVGLYINTLPLIVDHQTQRLKSVINAIKDIQDNINEINSRSNINLVKLQKKGQRLFDSLFIYENYPNPTNIEQQNKLNISFETSIENLDYPLAVIAYETNNKLIFSLKYAGELFHKDTIERLLSITMTLLTQIVTTPKQGVEELAYLAQEEYTKLINTYNETDKPYPDNKTLHQLFEEQVEKTPGNIAVVYEDTRLTYRELNERANQLANYVLLNYNIKPDTLIILCLDRSEHMLIAILAALKAGAAYVPIDPNYPDERLRYILEDTQKANGTLGVVETIILTNEIYGDRLRGLATETKPSTYSISLVVINSLPLIKELATYSSTLNPHGITTSVNLAYIIYTSGTTGNPKGVMVEHRSVVNYVKSIELNNIISPIDKVDGYVLLTVSNKEAIKII